MVYLVDVSLLISMDGRFMLLLFWINADCFGFDHRRSCFGVFC